MKERYTVKNVSDFTIHYSTNCNVISTIGVLQSEIAII